MIASPRAAVRINSNPKDGGYMVGYPQRLGWSQYEVFPRLPEVMRASTGLMISMWPEVRRLAAIVPRPEAGATPATRVSARAWRRCSRTEPAVGADLGCERRVSACAPNTDFSNAFDAAAGQTVGRAAIGVPGVLAIDAAEACRIKFASCGHVVRSCVCFQRAALVISRAPPHFAHV